MSRNSKAKRDRNKKKMKRDKYGNKVVQLSRGEKIAMWFNFHFTGLHDENLNCGMCADYLGNHCPGHNLDDDGVDLCAEASLSVPSSSYEIVAEGNRGAIAYIHEGRNGDCHIHILGSDQEILENMQEQLELIGYEKTGFKKFTSDNIGYC